MRTASSLALPALLLGAASSALAYSKDVTVTAVGLSPDYDTATIQLSRDPGEKVFVGVDVYVGDSLSTVGGAGVNQQGPIVTMGGIRNRFDSSGAGYTRYRLQFRTCPYEEPYTHLHEYQYCSQEFVMYVTYNPTGAQDDTALTITRATVSTDKDSITVELSKTIQKGYIQYERHGSGNGYDYSSMQYRADGKQVVVLTGMRAAFATSGTSGKQSITLRPCAEQPNATDGTTDCGPQYPLTIALTASASYRDAPNSHANAAAIRYAQQQGIVAGYSDGTFQPDSLINRAEFTKIITLALYGQEMIDKCGTIYGFSDVPSDAWYVRYICRARDGWLLTGYPDNTFRPAQRINFAEAAKILANAYSLIHREEHCNGKLCPDVDTPDHPWFEQYVRALVSRSAVPFSITGFDRPITRGEMAEMMYRLKAGVTNKLSKTYENLQ
mgnify:CR=1 FL=1